MSKILEVLDGVECDMDDVLIYGRTQPEHNQRLDAALQRLRNPNVTFNAEECTCILRLKCENPGSNCYRLLSFYLIQTQNT